MKTIKFLSMAALALVGAMMTGCSNDDEIIETPQQPVNSQNVETLTTTVGFDEVAETRALTSGGVKTFAAGDQLALVYKNKSGQTVKTLSTALPSGDYGSSATFTFELVDADKTKDVTYIYPASMAKADGTVNYDALNSQNGTLGTLESSLDLATYAGAWNGTSLPAGTLVNQLAVCALTLKDNATPTPNTITSGLTEVTVSDGSNTYTVTPTSSTFGEDVIYVAIRPVTAALQYTATDGTKNYTKTATSREYAAGNFYNLGLKMTKPAATVTTAPTAKTGVKAGQNVAIVNEGAAEGGTMMYMVNATQPASTDGFSATVPTAEGLTAGTYYVWYYVEGDASHTDSEISATGIEVTIAAASLIVNPAVGQVIGDDGKNYDYASLPGGVTAVAKICYVSGEHGLALALTDESSSAMNWDTAKTTCAAHTPAFTGGTWKLATKDEWTNMITAAGDYTALRTGFEGVGGSNLQETTYWSSTEQTAGVRAQACNFNNGKWSNVRETNNARVRACLAF